MQCLTDKDLLALLFATSLLIGEADDREWDKGNYLDTSEEKEWTRAYCCELKCKIRDICVERGLLK